MVVISRFGGSSMYGKAERAAKYGVRWRCLSRQVCLCGEEGLHNGGQAEILYRKRTTGIECVDVLVGRDGGRGLGQGFGKGHSHGHDTMSASNGHSGA